MTRLLAALAAVIAVPTLSGAASAAKPAPANGLTDGSEEQDRTNG